MSTVRRAWQIFLAFGGGRRYTHASCFGKTNPPSPELAMLRSSLDKHPIGCDSRRPVAGGNTRRRSAPRAAGREAAERRAAAAPKDLDGYFPFAVPKSPAEWEQRAERVRRQMLVSQGLWPMPTKTPLNAVDARPDRPGRLTRSRRSISKACRATSSPAACIGPKKSRRQAAGRALPARALGQRPVSRRRARSGAAADRARGRAVRGRRPLPAAGPLRATGAAWAASCSTTTCSATPTARSFRSTWSIASPSSGRR